MGGKKPSNRFIQDLLTVMEGLQRVGYVASKQQGKSLGTSWKKYGMDKSTQDVIKQLEDPGNIIRKTEDIDPLAMIKKSLFIGENMATFSSAASYKVYRRSQIDLGIATKKRGRSKYRLHPLDRDAVLKRAAAIKEQEMMNRTPSGDAVSTIRDKNGNLLALVDEDDYMDDAQFDEYDDSYDEDILEYEYLISPEKSSLSLIRNVEDFTNRKQIFSSMFMAVPKNRYRSEFVPRKFAVIGEDTDSLETLKQWSQESSANESMSAAENKIDRLSTASKARHVPSSRVGRLANFSSLGIGLGIGTIAEASRRAIGLGKSSESQGSLALSEANVDRIVATLCGVRGAALKIGQMLSIQDESTLNPQISKLFERVRQSADYMPENQLEKVMIQEFGQNWLSDNFNDFNKKPFAAASIGQVHLASLKEDGRKVAVKVQYPGIAKGIESDIKNLMGLLRVINILPEGMYIDNVIKHMTVELQQECDYEREAHCCDKMKTILEPYPQYYVPSVISELSTKQVMTCEYIEGLTIDECADQLDQPTRNDICLKFLDLMLRELFIHRYMQTDPNWANFLYNTSTGKLGLLDFGATREWGQSFVGNYFKIIQGGANGDRHQVLENSVKVGFLTGYESNEMNKAHVDSVMILSEPFREDKMYDFATSNATQRMQELVPVMIKHRLCPPPSEIYSLHRKMGGLFLMAAKLKANINCSSTYREIEAEFNTMLLSN